MREYYRQAKEEWDKLPLGTKISSRELGSKFLLSEEVNADVLTKTSSILAQGVSKGRAEKLTEKKGGGLLYIKKLKKESEN